MQINSLQACEVLGLPCHKPGSSEKGDNVPLLLESSFDSRRPAHGYCESDLKTPYLSRQQLNARMIAPTFEGN